MELIDHEDAAKIKEELEKDKPVLYCNISIYFKELEARMKVVEAIILDIDNRLKVLEGK
jgi:hypothetical protein